MSSSELTHYVMDARARPVCEMADGRGGVTPWAQEVTCPSCLEWLEKAASYVHAVTPINYPAAVAGRRPRPRCGAPGPTALSAADVTCPSCLAVLLADRGEDQADADDEGVWWPELARRLSRLAEYADAPGRAARAVRILIEREPAWFLADDARDFHQHVSKDGVIDWGALVSAAAAWPADRRFVTTIAAAMMRGDVETAESEPEAGQLDERRHATWQAMRAAYAGAPEGADAYLTAVVNSPLAALGRGFTRYAATLRAEGVEVPEPVMAAAAVLQDPGASPEQTGQAANLVTRFSASRKAPGAA
jgi:hypothetical protein